MSTGKIFAYIGAALFIIFGALFILGSGDPTRGGGFGWIFIGIILIAVGLALVWLASRKPKTTAAENATYKVELSGNVKMETLKCKSCGGTLSSDNVKMVAGAPVVTCPYCNTTYQLTEEPKW